VSRVDPGPILDLPDLPPGHRLHGVLRAALVASGLPAPPRAVDPAGLWSADFLGLSGVDAYEALSPTDRAAVRARRARDLLAEAWWIEKAGMAFAARMALLARTAEERALYDLFAADEARHFHAVGAWLPAPPPPTPFHRVLEDAIATRPAPVLVFVVQLVLEGWGLRHYRDLARHARSAELRALLEGILEDEARHHGSGALLVADRPPEGPVVEGILEVLRPFLGMVAAGPVGALEALEATTGPLPPARRARAFHQLGGADHARARLDLIAGLLRGEAAAPVRRALLAEGALSPQPLLPAPSEAS
jgi:rubrerythrin